MRLLDTPQIRSSGNLKLRAASLLSLCKTSFILLNIMLVSRDKDYLTERSSIDQHNLTAFFSELCCAWSREAGALQSIIRFSIRIEEPFYDGAGSSERTRTLIVEPCLEPRRAIGAIERLESSAVEPHAAHGY